MSDLKVKIKQFLQLIELECSEQQIKLFNDYLQLLNKWNKAFNLTAVRDINQMLERHLIDSLSIAEHIEGSNLIDVGTGPGLPGIPLAILWPERNIHLLDSNGKKTRFLTQIQSELDIENITVINGRVESFKPEKRFDGVLSRAFASLDEMLQGSSHLCKNDGYFYAMKGQFPEMELQAIKKPYKVRAIQWRSQEAERHLVIIHNSDDSEQK